MDSIRLSRRTVAAWLVVTGAALAMLPCAALAAAGTEPVQGTALSTLSLSAGTGGTFVTNFAPGGTATATGALTATDTNPSWTLQVKDAAAGDPGHMAAAATGCSGSDSSLTNALTISVTSPLGGVTSAGTVTLSGANQTVASASSQLLAANVLTTHYTQSIPSSEVMLTGCVYSLTATYTLQ